LHAAACVSIDTDALLVLFANVCVVLAGVVQGAAVVSLPQCKPRDSKEYQVRGRQYCLHAAACVSIDADALPVLVLISNARVVLAGVVQGAAAEHAQGQQRAATRYGAHTRYYMHACRLCLVYQPNQPMPTHCLCLCLCRCMCALQVWFASNSVARALLIGTKYKPRACAMEPLTVCKVISSCALQEVGKFNTMAEASAAAEIPGYLDLNCSRGCIQYQVVHGTYTTR
jgi:hypothetical protein